MKTNAPTLRPRRASRLTSQRGSAIIVALIFSIVTAVIAGSYLALARHTLTISNRAFFANSAVNLAEAGLEQAIWSIRKKNWTDWQSVGANEWVRTFGTFDFQQNAKGTVRVYVFGPTNSPTVVARASIQPHRGAPVQKWVEVNLTQRSMWENQFVAENILTISGNNPYIRGYFSHLGPYQAPLSRGTVIHGDWVVEANRTNDFGWGTVGAGGIQPGAANLGNADLWGSISIGSANRNDVRILQNGTLAGESVYGRLDPQGTVDLSRVTPDFRPNFEDAKAPNATYVPLNNTIVGTSVTLPRASDSPASDGVYYYSANSIALRGSGNDPAREQRLTVAAGRKVVLLMNKSATSTGEIDVSGNGRIHVENGGSLHIYTAADVDITGNGAVNLGGKPSDLRITSIRAKTDTSAPQVIKIAGNGTLSTVIYAPNADLEIKGGGNSTSEGIFGGAIAENIKMTGNSYFICDLSLGLDRVDGAMTIGRWRELTTATERGQYTSKLGATN